MGRNPKFEIRLTEEQRARLEDIAHNGKAKAKRILHARILLMADEDHPRGRWHDLEIAKALGTHRNTVQRVRTAGDQQHRTRTMAITVNHERSLGHVGHKGRNRAVVVRGGAFTRRRSKLWGQASVVLQAFVGRFHADGSRKGYGTFLSKRALSMLRL